jgi:starch-binding outer membrane protein, SusD/RagB family
MESITHQFNTFKSTIIVLIIILAVTSCQDFIEIDPPKTALTTEAVFTNEETATAAVVRLYIAMTQYYTSFVSGETSLNTLSGLAADELINYSAYNDAEQFSQNAITPTNSSVNQNWMEIYGLVYSANAVLEGLQNSKGISPTKSGQLKGEAKFVRALLYFYLVNFWGDVPLLTTTNYQANAVAKRTSSEIIYQQIIADLKEAQQVLPVEPSTERIRPSKSTATALLARVYLYSKNWNEAETQASAVISNPLFELQSDLDNIFFKESKETIWQLQSIATNISTHDGNFFILISPPTSVSSSDVLLNTFELGDERKMHWTSSYSEGSDTWYYPFKYKVRDLPTATSPKTEYLVVFRLVEQFLIRAEARAQQGNIADALQDLNVVRNRASLPDSPALDQASILLEIEQQRRFELFSEWSHRWLDLKRTGRADVVLGGSKSGWQSTDVLFPIPQQEIDRNRQLTQNQGY